MRLSTEEYVKRCNTYTELYIEGVETNYITVGKYIKKIISKYKSLLKNETYVFRQDKVNKVFSFFSFLNINHKDNYVQFPLLPWQCFLLTYVFGFYYKSDTEKRLIREAVLFIGRKNGKTALSSAIQLYGMLGDNVICPQSLLLANTAQQAAVALNFAKDMVIHTPELKERLMGQRSRIIFSDFEKQGFCQIFSTVDPARLEGYSPSMCICDECHNWETNTIYQAVKTGTGARKNPLLMIISTAGSKHHMFFQDIIDYHKNILDEKINDDSTVGFIYQLDEEDDLSNTDNWYKANPSLTFINSLEDLKIAYNQAQFSYADKYSFATKNLNLFVDTPDTWIPEEYLLPLFENFNEEQFYGHDVYIGMDLSKNIDLSSIVLFIPKDDKFYVIPYFWLANFPGNEVRKSGMNLSNWIFDKWITRCETKTIDIQMIYNKLVDLSSKFNIISIQYDQYNTPVLISMLKDAGFNCEKFAQTATKFNAPMKALEDLVYNKKMIMKNPVLLWNFANIVLYIEPGNANIKIAKNKQNDSVDGCVALAMAIGGWLENTYGDEIGAINSYINANKNKPAQQ